MEIRQNNLGGTAPTPCPADPRIEMDLRVQQRIRVPTSGFTAYAKPAAAERTMINSRAGFAPGEP